MDYQVYAIINDMARRSVWADRAFAAFAQYGPLLFVAALAWLWIRSAPGSKRTGERLAVARGLVAAVLALALGQAIGLVYFRPQPYAIHPAHLLIAPFPHPSFPSDLGSSLSY